MKTIVFIFKNTPKPLVATALSASLISGLGMSVLIARINAALVEGKPNQTGFAIFAALVIITFVAGLCSGCIVNRFASQLLEDLRIRLAHAAAKVSLQRLESLGQTKILTNLTKDLTTISMTASLFIGILSSMTIVFCCLGYVALLSPFALATTLVCLGAASVFPKMLRRALSAKFLRLRELMDVLFSCFQGILEGAKELKLHAARREVFLKNGVEQTAQALKTTQIAASDVMIFVMQWATLVFLASAGLVAFVFPLWNLTDVSVLNGTVLVLLVLTQPVKALSNQFPMLLEADVSLMRVLELLDVFGAQHAESKGTSGEDHVFPVDRLRFQDVIYTYSHGDQEGGFRLGPIDLEVAPGELVFVIGGNGAGKTTFAKVLTGLYVPDGGSMSVGDRLVTMANREAYRQLFSAVFSDFYLFETLFGVPGEDVEKKGQAYLTKLKLEHKVRIEGDKFSTLSLSTGQRKRLALVAAYLEDRPVYLLDEWAADQDPNFKEIFYRELLPELKSRGKAVIVISHDDKYFDVADRIFKLEDGKIFPLELDQVANVNFA